MSYLPLQPNDWLKTQAKQFQDQLDQGKTFLGVEVQQDYDPTLGIPVVYGIQRIVGPVIYLSTKIDNANILYAVLALGEGQMGPVYRLYVDDQQVYFEQQANLTTGPLLHNVITLPLPGQKHRPSVDPNDQLFTVEYIDGRPGNTYSNLLREVYNNASSPPPPLYPNMAYLVCKFVYRESVYKAFPKVSVDVFGVRTRSLATWNGSAFSTTLANTFNPCDHVLDYLTNTRYGAGIPDSLIDIPSFDAVFDYIETTQVKTNPTDSTGFALWAQHTTLDTNRRVIENLNTMLTDFGLIVIYSNGKYRLEIEARSTSSTAISDADILDEIQIQKPSADVKYNSVLVDYVDTGNNFVRITQQFPRPSSSANVYLAQDGNYVSELRISSSTIGYAWQAQQMARRILFKSRNQDVYRFTMTKKAYQFTVGDIITLTSSAPALTNQQMRIVKMRINYDFTIEVECVKHDNTYYPPYSDIRATFGVSLIFPPTGQISTTTTPPSPGTQLAAGDSGATTGVVPTLPPEGGISINMFQIYRPYFRLSAGPQTGATLQDWPYLQRGGSDNTDWYLGRIYRQNNITQTWATVSNGVGYAPTGNGSSNTFSSASMDFSTYSRTGAAYSFGIQARVDTSVCTPFGNDLSGGTTATQSLKMSPVITYRYQNDTSTDPNRGKYRNSDFLLFVYSTNIDGSGNTTKFGFYKLLPGNVLETYYVDLAVSENVDIWRTGASKAETVHWTAIADRFPRLKWQPNPNSTLGGGTYGGIDNSDGRTCIQWLINNRLGFSSRPGINCYMIDGIGQTSVLSSARAIRYKIFSIADGRPEFIGEVQGTNWASTFRGCFNTASSSATNYFNATGIAAPFLS